MDFTIRIAKTKALISFAVTAKLICVFVFAYAKSRFSHDAAHIILVLKKIYKICTIYGYFGHLGHVTWIIYITCLPPPLSKEAPHEMALIYQVVPGRQIFENNCQIHLYSPGKDRQSPGLKSFF